MADVLIVDDEADIRDIISDLLRDEGYLARTAYDADSAFAAVEAAAPDLIILDIWLQGSRMDGIEILKSLRRSEMMSRMSASSSTIRTSVIGSPAFLRAR